MPNEILYGYLFQVKILEVLKKKGENQEAITVTTVTKALDMVNDDRRAYRNLRKRVNRFLNGLCGQGCLSKETKVSAYQTTYNQYTIIGEIQIITIQANGC